MRNGTFEPPCISLYKYYKFPSQFSEEQYAHSVTPLEQMCNATNFTHIFVNNKCYTMHTELKTYLAAKSSCNDFPGISGYLAQPRNSSDLNILNNLLMASCFSEKNFSENSETILKITPKYKKYSMKHKSTS
jgi:hypothetical protein